LKKLSGSEARLKAIQEALAGYPTSAPPLVQSITQNKRPSPTGSSATGNPPTKRARQLPPDWPSNDPLSKPSLSEKPSSSSTRDIRKPASDTPASSSGSSLSTKSKVASVFLSQEQKKILKLVQDGESVFYTGSAGKF
jgi:ATP-dependent DNA helicase PIF1